MKIVVMMISAIALLTIPARAQAPNPQTPWMSLPTKDDRSDHTPTQEKAVKADDKAYKSALDAIPQSKNYDPWHNVRAAPKSK